MGRCYRFLRARFASLVGRETFSVNWSCESDEHSVCEPVQPTYLRWPQLRETRLVELLFLEDVTAVLAMNPLSRAVPTDFLSVRVYLRSETTRSMGLGYLVHQPGAPNRQRQLGWSYRPGCQCSLFGLSCRLSDECGVVHSV